ncbi:EF-hand calcium-binding domain-containing protein 1 [Lithohypha guttulata]|uniref:EF-hand calcium-binding domain-containing protein 1 n=1 Tax=Lithohypha guttulata TaxID=1690604 RepID=UPI002DDE1837|nr:hypothetical protein LTR51_001939 [Lithohypha guttulata]
MQNQTGVPRGALLIASGAAALAIFYFSYKHFSTNQSPSIVDGKLHRSNAVRRRRRRWRHGSQPVELDYDPVDRALEHLTRREASGEGYGMYHNKYYVHNELLASQGETFILLPTKLEYIRDVIVEAHDLSSELSAQLSLHIQARFAQNFLQEEFPDGYILGSDADVLASKLNSDIDLELFKNIAELHDRGNEIVDADMWFHEELPPDTPFQPQGPREIAQALSGQDNGRNRPSRRGSLTGDEQEQDGGQNILDLLYRIGEEQAKWSGYQHRGVECNGCGMQPIRGTRYHCANCFDYDLCETCEHQQIHHKAHVFYKIRIPAPIRGQIKLVQPKWYPGNPNACQESIPKGLKMRLLRTINIDRQDLDALYDQFKCIAGREWPDDPDEIGMVIDRPSFDKYFTSTTADRPPTPNLIYDRIFHFYDKSNNGFINFSDFAAGMAELANDGSRKARINRLFRAFDLDEDGYVNRRDFLRMLQAHYDLNKTQTYEMIYSRDDAFLTDEEVHEVIRSNNPISAAFGGNSFAGHQSRHGHGKHHDMNGDLTFDSDVDEVLEENSRMQGNRADAIARQASDTRSLIRGHRLRDSQESRDEPVVSGHHLPPIPMLREEDSIMGSPRSQDEGIDQLGHLADSWPASHLQESDVQQALGADIPLEDVMDPLDRRRVVAASRHRLYAELETNNFEVEQAAVHERWQRRQFYRDVEEGLEKPAGYAESDSSDDLLSLTNGSGKKHIKSDSGHPSFRSRSSSKVRFDDSAVDHDADSKSDISSRNIPANERWGGFEFSQSDRDVGVEIIYEAVQEAFNEMLNHFFKDKEDRAIDAKRSRAARRQYAAELQAYEDELKSITLKKEKALLDADEERTRTLFEQYAVNSEPAGSAATDDPSVSMSTVDNNHALDSALSQLDIPDPTLPQNRPNEASSQLTTPDDKENPTIKINSALLGFWHQHRFIDQEAKERGGYGRLTLQEFKRKLRDESTDIDIGGDNSEDFWEAKADLGKFSFLSSWIEMASF